MDSALQLTSIDASHERSVALTGAFNFRDLGGYVGYDGRIVRWRTLFRGDGLGRLTPGDVEVLRPFGLRTVVDLRMTDELERAGRFPVADYPVAYHHRSVFDRTSEMDWTIGAKVTPAEFFYRCYTEILAEAGHRFGEVLRVLATPGALPAVFHCAAGKDRTGLLAMLMLGALGVGHDDIVDDYALTSRTMDAFLEARSTDLEIADQIADVPRMFFAADPAAMSLVLRDIEAAHGSVRAYVETLGLSEAELINLESQLLTD